MDWNYIAGFFDGEGTISCFGKHKVVRVVISQTNQEVLDKIKDFTGVGNVIKETKRESHWKDSWIYYISKNEDSLMFLESLVDKLIVKKDRAVEIMNVLYEKKGKLEAMDIIRRKRFFVAKRMRDSGSTYQEIAEELDIDRGYARKLLLRGVRREA